jgi:hypothetical protein
VTADQGPVRIATANLDFATGVRRDTDQLRHLVARLFALPAKHGKVAGLVLGTQETKNFRLVAVLRAIGGLLGRFHLPRPEVMQGHGAAKAGTAIAAYRVRLLRRRLFLGGTSRSTLPRWVTRAWVQLPSNVLEILDAHVPPPRAGSAAQLRYLHRVRKRTARAERRGHGWAVLADFNRNIHAVAEILGGKVIHGSTTGGIGIIVSHDVEISASGRDTYGLQHHDTDHPAVWADVDDVRAAA